MAHKYSMNSRPIIDSAYSKVKYSSKLDPSNYLKYSGVQLDSRQPTSYGMYTFQGWLNVDNKPTVSGLFVQSIQPNPGYYPDVAKFWRWTEIDWEYVPYTKALFQEALTCIGTLPNAVCAPQVGKTEYTADNKAKIVANLAGHPDITTWEQILTQTRGSNSTELLNKIKVVGKLENTNKWSDLVSKLEGTNDQVAKFLGTFLQPINDANWFALINQMKSMPNTQLAGNVVSKFGHSDVINFVTFASKAIELSAGEFARQVGATLKLPNPVSSFDELAKTIWALPQSTIAAFPQDLVSELGIGRAITGNPNEKWSKLAAIIKQSPLGDFESHINNLILFIDDFSQVKIINWDQLILNVASEIIGVTVTDKITNISQLYDAVKDMPDKAFIEQMAKAIGYTPDVVNWEVLLSQSDTTLPYWTAGDLWGIPKGTPAPTNDKFMTLNFWRVPEGDHTIKVNNITASFLPSVSIAFSGDVTANEQYFTITDKDGKSTYDPKEFHTYTLVWTQESLSYYIDAPNDGKDIQHSTPIKVFSVKDYPGLEMTGINYPGGESKFWWYGVEKNLGDVLIMLNHYFDPGWGGIPGDDFTKSSCYLKKVGYFPLKSSTISGKLTSSDFVYDSTSGLDIDFSKMPVANWRYELQKLFVAEVTADFLNGYIIKNPEQMILTSDTPDKSQALELRLSTYDYPQAAQTFFYVALDSPEVTGAAINKDQTIAVSIDSDPAKGGVGAYVSLTNINTINIDSFWAPLGSTIPIHVKNLGTGAENTCNITIEKSLTWSFKGPQDCTSTRTDLQFLNAADAGASSLKGNQGRIPIHWNTFQGAPSFDEALIDVSGNVIRDDHDEL